MTKPKFPVDAFGGEPGPLFCLKKDNPLAGGGGGAGGPDACKNTILSPGGHHASKKTILSLGRTDAIRSLHPINQVPVCMFEPTDSNLSNLHKSIIHHYNAHSLPKYISRLVHVTTLYLGPTGRKHAKRETGRECEC